MSNPDIREVLAVEAAEAEAHADAAEVLHRNAQPRLVKYLITPALAQEWLDQETDCSGLVHRPVNEATAQGYARLMRNGQWDWEHPEGISLRGDGAVLNGRQRLRAIVINGDPVRMYVTENAPSSALLNFDKNRTRRSADDLTYLGFPDARNLSAVARKIAVWNSGRPWTGYTPMGPEVVALAQDKDVRAAASFGAAWRAEAMLARNDAGFVWYVLRQVDEAKASEFMAALLRGASLDVGHPVFALRETLLRERLRLGRRLQRRVVIFLVFQAWAVYAAGKQRWKRFEIPDRVTNQMFYETLGLPQPDDG
jgi:hypothetical protein